MHKNEVCFFPHSVITVGQNREAYQRGERNSNGITQPSGAATPRNSDAHERIAVPQALCVLRECPRPRPQNGKVCRSDTRPGDVCERAERSEGSDTPPHPKRPVFRRVSRCVRSCWRRQVCTRRSPLKRTLRRLCEYDLEPRWRGLSHAIWDAPSAYFRQIRRLAEDFIYSRIKGWRRNRRST